MLDAADEVIAWSSDLIGGVQLSFTILFVIGELYVNSNTCL